MIQLDRIIDLISELNSEGTVSSIYHALEELSHLLKLDRCVLRNRMCDTDEFNVIAEWCSEGLLPIDVLEPKMNSMASLSLIKMMLDHGEVRITDVFASPEFTQEEVDKARNWGCRAFLFIPLRYQGAINGMIIAIQSRDARQWTPDDRHAIQLLGETALAVWLHNQSLQALSASKQQYQWALDASHDAIWDWDVRRKRLNFSLRFYLMLGYRDDGDVIDNDKFLKHLHPDDLFFITQSMNSVLRNDIPSSFIEFRVFTLSGDMLWLRSSGRVVERNSKGLPVRVVGTYSDITTFKQTLQQLELARENADRANIAKSEFLAKMSHEVRTPLNAIMGMLYLLMDEDSNEAQREKLHIMQDASTHLLNVLNSVLDLSKIESGKLELETIPFSIEEVVTQVFSMLMVKAEEKGLQLAVDFSPELPAMLLGDSNRLSQILTNLLANAIKFTDAGEVLLFIRLRQKLGELYSLEFSIQDSGIGIADAEMAVLFSSFAQAKKSIAREYGGSGLGLSICKSLVELMGGNIYAESTVGVGSTFRFGIQLKAWSVSDTLFVQMPELQSKQVLLLCSNSKCAAIYQSLLVNLHIKVRVIQAVDIDVVEVLETSTEFDVVMVDSSWVDQNSAGFELLTQLGLMKRQVIFSVSRAHEDWKVLLSPFPHIHFMSKPLTPRKMIQYFMPASTGTSLGFSAVKVEEANMMRLADLTIMLIEDNLVNRMIAVAMLAKYGVKVVEMSSGEQALDYVRQSAHVDIDMVLMDIEMPGLNGYETTIALRKLSQLKNIPVVAMTANILSTDIERCYRSGMNAHIPKPVEPSKLINTLLELLPA